MHGEPKDGAYPPPRRVGANDALAASLIPELNIALASIPGLDAA